MDICGVVGFYNFFDYGSTDQSFSWSRYGVSYTRTKLITAILF